MKNISWSANMVGYQEERLADSIDVISLTREEKSQFKLDVALTLLLSIQDEMNSLYTIHAHKELYDCIILLRNVNKQLNQLK